MADRIAAQRTVVVNRRCKRVLLKNICGTIEVDESKYTARGFELQRSQPISYIFSSPLICGWRRDIIRKIF